MYTVGVCLKHFVLCLSAVFLPQCWLVGHHLGHHLSHHHPNTRYSCTLMEWFVKLLSATPTTKTHTSPASSPSIPSSGQPRSQHLTCAWSWGSTGRVLKYAVFLFHTCVHSGGSTVTVNGFYLHSALQPQMVLTAATEGKLFQMVVSVHSPHRVPRHQIPLFPCHRHVSIINPTEQRSRSADLRNKGSNVSQLHSWRGNGKITHLINNVLNKYVCHFFFPLSKFLNSFLETFQLFLCSFF